jgi:Zn-dependent alcohol dehydrogenase
LSLGSGYVQQVGSEVKSARVGDSVLLSFQSCSTCKDCLEGHPSYCQSFAPFNYGGDQEVFQIADGSKTSGAFIGQSSFASHTIVKDSSIVNVSGIVKHEEELKLFAPLGCGFQSGMGTVTQLTRCTEKDAVVIMGLGGVGLTAIMVNSVHPFF